MLHRCLQQGSGARRRHRRRLQRQPEYGFHRQTHPHKPNMKTVSHQAILAVLASTADLTSRRARRAANPPSSSQRWKGGCNDRSAAIPLPLVGCNTRKAPFVSLGGCNSRAAPFVSQLKDATPATAPFISLQPPPPRSAKHCGNSGQPTSPCLHGLLPQPRTRRKDATPRCHSSPAVRSLSKQTTTAIGMWMLAPPNPPLEL